MAEDSGDRTEPATAKRLSKAREEGNVPRSRELSTFSITMTGVVMLTVLASACGGIPELIQPDRTGFLIDSLAPEALARQIRDLAAQPALRDAVARNALEAWRGHYTLAEYQRRILSIMETAGTSARR